MAICQSVAWLVKSSVGCVCRSAIGRSWWTPTSRSCARIAGKIKEQLPREIEFDDLYNYGMQGLLEAAERYDRKHGVTFQTFAYYRVRGAMFDGLRNMGWLPRHEYARLRFEERAAAYLSNLTEREAGAPAASCRRW